MTVLLLIVDEMLGLSLNLFNVVEFIGHDEDDAQLKLRVFKLLNLIFNENPKTF